MILKNKKYNVHKLAVLTVKLATSDLRRRFASSYLGGVWIIGQPLLMSMAYILVFGIFMGDVLPGRRYGGALFIPYYMMGFALWTFFIDIVTRSPSMLLENRHLVTKIKFPHFILPFQYCLTAFFPFFVIFCVAIFSLLYNNQAIFPTSLWYVFVSIFLTALFAIGLSWFFGALGVFLSDLHQIISIVVMLWFFATPILYPVDLVEQKGGIVAWLVIEMNPLTTAVEMFRAPFFNLNLEWDIYMSRFVIISVATFLLGGAVYRKLSKDFSDFL